LLKKYFSLGFSSATCVFHIIKAEPGRLLLSLGMALEQLNHVVSTVTLSVILGFPFQYLCWKIWKNNYPGKQKNSVDDTMKGVSNNVINSAF